ncbi:MAG: NAD(P)-dependent alcohol dehydrogenase [Phycisphaerales bacterium]|nr:MAG: NAD(P)-dependent alcohol dehydrogenase [Phycisphaerales bacterium]
MRAYGLEKFGIENLQLVDAPDPAPGPEEVVVDVKALSLNYRDLLVMRGTYNPRLPLPAVPISDGAGVISAAGGHVTRVAVGDRVTGHFVAGWIDGRFRREYIRHSLGTPGPGMAAERVVLPAEAVVPIPPGYDFAQAATLPIAALTAWSALVTEGQIGPGQTVLTLGTGGVSIFVVQIGKALDAKVIITSSSDDKLRRAAELGAAHTINYEATPAWEERVEELTDGLGVDLTVETGGARTLQQSMAATRAGGRIAMLGALTGLEGELNVAPVLMKRLRICGIYVDSRAAFEAMNVFLAEQRIMPVIDRVFPFEALPEALRLLESGAHFGKIVVTLEGP